MYRSLLPALLGASCLYTAPILPQKISSGQLKEMVTAGQNGTDSIIAERLTGMELTDQLSGSRLADLMVKLPGDKSRMELTILADQSIFLAPPADEVPADAAPDSAALHGMLVKIVNYVNTTVRELPNLSATRFTNAFEDRPREERLTSTGIESLGYLPLHWVGSLNVDVTYRERQEVEDKGARAKKQGEGVAGLITNGEFGPILSTVLADALKGKITWAGWEKDSDATLAVFHYQVPEERSNYHVKFCCVTAGADYNGNPTTPQLFDVRAAYHGDIVFNLADGSIRRLTLEAEMPQGGLVAGAGIAIEYADTEIGGHRYICPVKSISMLKAHEGQQSAAFSMADYKGPAKVFMNDVTFSNYRRFGSEMKILEGPAAQ